MNFEELKAKLSGRSVLVYGDHYLDRNGIGRWHGFSREEEELPIFHMFEELYNPGGAGNLAATFAALGVKTTVAGVWGTEEDWNRKILEDEFRKRGIDTSGMVEGGRTPKFEKCYFKSGVHIIRMDLDAEELSLTTQQACCEKLKWLLKDEGNFDFLAVADYDETNKGVCFPRALEILSTYKKPKFGTSRARVSRFKGFDLLILNRKELIEQIGDGEMTLNLRAAFLMSITGADGIVITLAGQGVEVFQHGKKSSDLMTDTPLSSFRVRSEAVSGRVDPCGCGDTLYATFVSALSAGYDSKESAQLGNAAARAVVRKKYGAATPTLDEIEAEYQEMYEGVRRDFDE